MLSLVREILVFCGPLARRIRLAWMTSLVTEVCRTAPIGVAIALINAILTGAATPAACLAGAGGMLALLGLQALAQHATDRLQASAGYEVFAAKRLEVAAHLRRVPMGYLGSGALGRVATVLSVDMPFVEEQAMRVLAGIVSDVVTQGIILAFLLVLHPAVGLLAAGVVAAAALLAHLMHRQSARRTAQRQESLETLTAAVIEYTEGLAVSKSFNRSGHSAEELREAFAQMTRTNLDVEHAHIPWQRRLMVLYGTGVAAVIALAVHLLASGGIAVGTFIGVVLFSFLLFKPVEHLFGQDAVVVLMKASMDRIRRVLDEPEMQAGGDLLPGAGADHEVELRNVSFSYGEQEVLHDVSLVADRGQTVALVGMSGSGKTTIASLIARFWDVDSGSVLVGGVDVRQMPVEVLMDRVAMVFQHAYLFEDTIFSNIALGRPEATSEQVREAARKARCLDFIEALPDGFETRVGPGGTSLSGGQVQRLSIARCILKDAPIIILDEATASIDADNEVAIQAAMSEVCQGKTTIVIAHRLRTIRGADRIMVLDHGRVVGAGTHQELMDSCDTYAAMVSADEGALAWSGGERQ